MYIVISLIYQRFEFLFVVQTDEVCGKPIVQVYQAKLFGL